jgi:hypothetical protein
MSRTRTWRDDSPFTVLVVAPPDVRDADVAEKGNQSQGVKAFGNNRGGMPRSVMKDRAQEH